MRAPDGTPLYVHVPFCEAKCPYCDFFSLVADGHDLGGTVDLLLAEAERRAARAPRTVFLGGGTPSLLPGPLLARLLDGLDRLTGFRASAEEVTAECNPESLSCDQAARLLDLGVTRLSIGFQSLRPATLELFGRVHSVEQSFRAYDAARDAGCARVNVDLIYAAPGQTPAEWEEDLARVLALAPDHLAAYELTFEEDTPFHRWRDAGRLQQSPEEVALEMFAATRARAAAAGLEPYEVSNLARPGEACRHNLEYWANRPYVGIGPSAVSKVGHVRSGNPRALGPWAEGVRRPDAPAEGAWREELPAAERLGETWWLGLRRAVGVDPAEARRDAGFDGPAEADPALALARGLEREGVLERDGGRFRLAPGAVPLADGVGRRFLARAAADG